LEAARRIAAAIGDLRMGISYGRILRLREPDVIFGITARIAGALCKACAPGRILVSPAVALGAGKDLRYREGDLVDIPGTAESVLSLELDLGSDRPVHHVLDRFLLDRTTRRTG
jgi:class 3 adenylate cyclase